MRVRANALKQVEITYGLSDQLIAAMDKAVPICTGKGGRKDN